MKYLDRKKAKEIIEREVKKTKPIHSAELVLAGDEYWNCELIYINGTFHEQKDFKCHYASMWATPTLVITYRDKSERRFECYSEEEISLTSSNTKSEELNKNNRWGRGYASRSK